MFRTSIGGQCNSLGLGVPINIQIDSDAGEGFQDEIAAGAAGSLTTRTDANTGVVTLGAGHSIVTGKVDVAWTGGARCNMDATVNGNACTIDGGEGDDLPIATTTVVVSGQTSTGRDLVGDHLDVLILYSNKRAHVTFVDAGGAVLMHRDILEGRTQLYIPDSAATNPLAGDVVADVLVSNGDATSVAIVTVLFCSTQ